MPAAIDNDHSPGRRDKVGRAGQNCHRDVVRFDDAAQRRQVGCFLQGGEISPGYEIGIHGSGRNRDDADFRAQGARSDIPMVSRAAFDAQ
jgi:hypothetical protein